LRAPSAAQELVSKYGSQLKRSNELNRDLTAHWPQDGDDRRRGAAAVAAIAAGAGVSSTAPSPNAAAAGSKERETR
jgi:hypothetical protein